MKSDTEWPTNEQILDELKNVISDGEIENLLTDELVKIIYAARIEVYKELEEQLKKISIDIPPANRSNDFAYGFNIGSLNCRLMIKNLRKEIEKDIK